MYQFLVNLLPMSGTPQGGFVLSGGVVQFLLFLYVPGITQIQVVLQTMVALDGALSGSA